MGFMMEEYHYTAIHALFIYDICHEKMCLWEFSPSKTQIGTSTGVLKF